MLPFAASQKRLCVRNASLPQTASIFLKTPACPSWAHSPISLEKDCTETLTYFNRNFHIEPTNVCVFACKFCSYSRLYAHREEGWELSTEQMLDIVKKYDGKPVTEVHIVGGVHPEDEPRILCRPYPQDQGPSSRSSCERFHCRGARLYVPQSKENCR